MIVKVLVKVLNLTVFCSQHLALHDLLYSYVTHLPNFQYGTQSAAVLLLTIISPNTPDMNHQQKNPPPLQVSVGGLSTLRKRVPYSEGGVSSGLTS